MTFDFWQRWGIDLDDVSFANAWIALGLVRGPKRRSVYELLNANWHRPVLNWTFPSKDTEVEGTPKEWASAWTYVAGQIPEPTRLRVHRAPPNELILPWYRMLSEADPAPGAVSLVIQAPRAQLHIDWPLRLGCISDDGWNIVEKTTELWPSLKVTQRVRLDRDQSNCDILIEKSSAKTLLQKLLQQPVEVKANIVMLQGGEATVWAENRALLTSVLALTRASGFILVPPEITDEHLRLMINSLVEELSHDVPVDTALGASIREMEYGDLVAGFTPKITRFVIDQLVDRYNERVAALPPDTALDMSGVGPSNEWLTYGVSGGGVGGGTAKSMAPPDADRHVLAHTIRIERNELDFSSESEGGSTLAEVSRAMETASAPPTATSVRAARFLQQKSFVRVNSQFQDATMGFIAGAPAMVRVRIAVPEEGWDSLASAFPVEKLPQHLERWNLTVWLTEPDHLPTPLKRRIKLPRDGNSTECDFHFRPRADFTRFNGRLTVLHRGRIIQTAVLRAAVVPSIDKLVEGAAPKLEELVAVRNRIGNLEERRQFDVAFVANHDEKGRPLLTAVSNKAAWVKDLSKLVPIAGKINETLIPVAKSVADYAEGLRSENGRQLLIKLAKHGGWLKLYLDEQLGGAGNNPLTSKAEFLQVVSTRSDAVVPFEFVYDYAVPRPTAKVCEHWLDAAKTGKELEECAPTCDRTSGHVVCPMGFWGLQKVIERHAVTPEQAKDGNVLYLQSEPTRQTDTLHLGGIAVIGSSNNVPKENVAELKKLINRCCGVAPKLATDWDKWEKLVQECRPSLLIALAHTDGKDSDVTLEIGGEAIESITLRDTHVFPPPLDGRQPPLVALIGCDTAGTASEYGNHVVCLRARGAGIVIGTIATVFGPHAAKVAGKLVEGLLVRSNDKPVRLGELMRTIRRNSLLEGLLMPLCLVAYGDADWIISPRKADV